MPPWKHSLQQQRSAADSLSGAVGSSSATDSRRGGASSAGDGSASDARSGRASAADSAASLGFGASRARAGSALHDEGPLSAADTEAGKSLAETLIEKDTLYNPTYEYNE